jgi:hypothetical protein
MGDKCGTHERREKSIQNAHWKLRRPDTTYEKKTDERIKGKRVSHKYIMETQGSGE